MMQPTDKLPLRSNFEDLEEFNKKHIDPIMGTIYKKKESRFNTDEERIKQRFDPTVIDDSQGHEEHKKIKALEIDQIPDISSQN